MTAATLPATSCSQSADLAGGAQAAAETSPPPSGGATPVTSAAVAAPPSESPPGIAETLQPSQGPHPSPARQSQAQAILGAAVRMLENRSSVSAAVRTRIDLFGKQLVGSGVYFQQGAGEDQLIRLELRIQAGDQVSSLLQVLSPPTPEGHYLWIHRKLPGEAKLSRINVVRATRALENAENLPGRGAEDVLPGLGGVPRLLRGLQAAFDFDSAQKGRFDGLPVWRLQGRWKPDRLAKVLPDLPDHVVLMLGQEDLFPRRIEYGRSITEKDGRQDACRTLVTMELFDVEFDAPVDRMRFVYNPGKTAFTDETQSFIRSLRATR